MTDNLKIKKQKFLKIKIKQIETKRKNNNLREGYIAKQTSKLSPF